MKAFALLVALTVTAFADSDYEPVEWITVTEDGGVEAVVGNLLLSAAPVPLEQSGEGCIYLRGIIILSKWQVLIGSEWVDVPGTEVEEGVCGIEASTLPSGENRIVVEISIDGEVGKYASANTVIGTGDPIADASTAVKPATWGRLKFAM